MDQMVDAAVKDDDIMDVAYLNAAFLDVTVQARWWVVEAVDKKRARLNCIQHLLGHDPYGEVCRTRP
jgi:polyphosphate kinase 2 (PPK2 family)